MVLIVRRFISLKAKIVAMTPSTKKCGETMGNARTNYRNVRFYSQGSHTSFARRKRTNLFRVSI